MSEPTQQQSTVQPVTQPIVQSTTTHTQSIVQSIAPIQTTNNQQPQQQSQFLQIPSIIRQQSTIQPTLNQQQRQEVAQDGQILSNPQENLPPPLQTHVIQTSIIPPTVTITPSSTIPLHTVSTSIQHPSTLKTEAIPFKTNSTLALLQSIKFNRSKKDHQQKPPSQNKVINLDDISLPWQSKQKQPQKYISIDLDEVQIEAIKPSQNQDSVRCSGLPQQKQGQQNIIPANQLTHNVNNSNRQQQQQLPAITQSALQLRKQQSQYNPPPIIVNNTSSLNNANNNIVDNNIINNTSNIAAELDTNNIDNINNNDNINNVSNNANNQHQSSLVIQQKLIRQPIVRNTVPEVLSQYHHQNQSRFQINIQKPQVQKFVERQYQSPKIQQQPQVQQQSQVQSKQSIVQQQPSLVQKPQFPQQQGQVQQSQVKQVRSQAQQSQASIQPLSKQQVEPSQVVQPPQTYKQPVQIQSQISSQVHTPQFQTQSHVPQIQQIPQKILIQQLQPLHNISQLQQTQKVYKQTHTYIEQSKVVQLASLGTVQYNPLSSNIQKSQRQQQSIQENTQKPVFNEFKQQQLVHQQPIQTIQQPIQELQQKFVAPIIQQPDQQINHIHEQINQISQPVKPIQYIQQAQKQQPIQQHQQIRQQSIYPQQETIRNINNQTISKNQQLQQQPSQLIISSKSQNQTPLIQNTSQLNQNKTLVAQSPVFITQQLVQTHQIGEQQPVHNNTTEQQSTVPVVVQQQNRIRQHDIIPNPSYKQGRRSEQPLQNNTRQIQPDIIPTIDITVPIHHHPTTNQLIDIPPITTNTRTQIPNNIIDNPTNNNNTETPALVANPINNTVNTNIQQNNPPPQQQQQTNQKPAQFIDDLTDINQIRNMLLKCLPPNISQVAKSMDDDQLRQMYRQIRAQQAKLAEQSQPINTTSINATNPGQSQQKSVNNNKVDNTVHKNTKPTVTNTNNTNTNINKTAKKPHKKIITTTIIQQQTQQVEYQSEQEEPQSSKMLLNNEGELKRKNKKKIKNKEQAEKTFKQICMLLKGFDAKLLTGNIGDN